LNRLAPKNAPVALVVCLAALGVSSCAALLESALGAAQKTFLNAADKNYGNTYHDDLDKLLKTMVAKQEAPPPAAAPAPAATAEPTPASGAAPVAAPAPAAALVPLELEVALLREHAIDGRVVLEPIVDGDTLHDEYGPSGAADNFKITFLSIDSTAMVQPVFPLYSLSGAQPGSSNPVQAGRAYMIPEGAESIQLDSYRGIEHFYFLATRTRRSDLETQLPTFAAYKRADDPSRKKGERDEVAVAAVTEHAVASRGIKSSRQGVVAGVQTSAGTTAPVSTQVFGAKGDGDILVTRWFRHE